MIFRIDDIDIGLEYELIRSDRRSISVEITSDARAVVRAPKQMSLQDIEKFLISKYSWISSHITAADERVANAGDALSDAEKEDLLDRAETLIVPRVKHFASVMGVRYGRINIGLQKTRFGSCSRHGNLSFNALLALMPQEILDYVVVHELSHIKHMDHSSAFWAEVEKYIPNYVSRRAWLHDHGAEYILKL